MEPGPRQPTHGVMDAGAAWSGMPGATYAPDDVTLLFTDLTGVVEPLPADAVAALARSTAGIGHRMVVPAEQSPSAEALAAFTEILACAARRTALLGCALARRIVAGCRGRGIAQGEVVIASIARAGTPIGVVVTRILRERYAQPTTHYTFSLVPGLGIDVAAVRFMLSRHPAGAVQFVDGWTGKGGISQILRRELASAELDGGLSPELAVLTDPGSAAAIAGTRLDVLVPSAVLTAPVSGGFSRSFRPALLGPDEFHAVIRYPHLGAHDRSCEFVDAVCGRAAEIDEDDVSAAVAAVEQAGPPAFGGWAYVESLAAEFGTPNALNFVKPGLNETCRTLVARQPAVVLVDPSQSSAELELIRRLAADREVPVLERSMPYAAVGIAHG